MVSLNLELIWSRSAQVQPGLEIGHQGDENVCKVFKCDSGGQ